MQEYQASQPPKKCIYYFRYQMKIEFIPHIEEEIEEFIEVCQQMIYHPQYKQQIVSMINKRINDIDRFFHRHWNDYRIQLLLRSRKMLIEFTKQYHQFLANDKTISDQSQKEPIIGVKSSQTQRNVGRNSQKEEILERRGRQTQKSQNSRFNASNTVDRKKSNQAQSRSSDRLQIASTKEFKSSQCKPSQKINSPLGTGNKSSVKIQQTASKDFKQRQRVSSTSTGNLKVRDQLSKAVPTVSTPVKKMTKQQYIAYLKNKKTQ